MRCENSTHKRSGTDVVIEVGTTKVAVSRADDRVGVDKSTATRMTQVGTGNADYVREITLNSRYATNDVCSVLIPVKLGEFLFLGNSCTIDEGWDRKSGEDGFGVHVGNSGKRQAVVLLS